MMLGSFFCYILYDNKFKKIYFHTFLFLILTLIFFFTGSVTQYVSIAIGLIIVAILDIKFFFRKIFLNLLLLISILYSINYLITHYNKDYKNKCFNKFSESSLSIGSAITTNLFYENQYPTFPGYSNKITDRVVKVKTIMSFNVIFVCEYNKF